MRKKQEAEEAFQGWLERKRAEERDKRKLRLSTSLNRQVSECSKSATIDHFCVPAHYALSSCYICMCRQAIQEAQCKSFNDARFARFCYNVLHDLLLEI